MHTIDGPQGAGKWNKWAVATKQNKNNNNKSQLPSQWAAAADTKIQKVSLILCKTVTLMSSFIRYGMTRAFIFLFMYTYKENTCSSWICFCLLFVSCIGLDCREGAVILRLLAGCCDKGNKHQAFELNTYYAYAEKHSDGKRETDIHYATSICAYN